MEIKNFQKHKTPFFKKYIIPLILVLSIIIILLYVDWLLDYIHMYQNMGLALVCIFIVFPCLYILIISIIIAFYFMYKNRIKKINQYKHKLLNLSINLNWKDITDEMHLDFNIPSDFTRYAITEVNAISELQKNGNRIILLVNSLYTFKTQEEKIIIISNNEYYVFSENKEFISKFADSILTSEKQLSIQQENNTIKVIPLTERKKLYKSQIAGIIMVLVSIFMKDPNFNDMLRNLSEKYSTAVTHILLAIYYSLPHILLIAGLIMCFFKPKKLNDKEKALLELTKDLEWNVIPAEIRSEYNIPVRYTKYTIAEVSKITQRENENNKILMLYLKGATYTFKTDAENILIVTNGNYFAYSEYNEDFPLNNSTISQIGEN